MKRCTLFSLILCICVAVAAQKRTPPSDYNRIINDVNAAPETRVLACVQAGRYYVDKSSGSPSPKELDTAVLMLEKGRNLNKTANIHSVDGELLYLEARIDKFKGRNADAKRLNELALTELQKKPGSEILGRALLEKGEYLDIGVDDELWQKVKLLRQALPYFNTPKTALLKAITWKRIGDLYMERSEKQDNVAQAMYAYQQAIQINLANGKKNIHDIYIELAFAYQQLGDNHLGLNYCLLAVQTAEKDKDTTMTLCQVYNVTGNQYTLLLDDENARKYYFLAFKVAEHYKDQRSLYWISLNLFHTYARQKNWAKMKEVINKLDAVIPDSEPHKAYFQNYFWLTYYSCKKDIPAGKEYCLKLTSLAEKADARTLRALGIYIYDSIVRYYLEAHDYKNAYKFWERNIEIVRKYDLSPANINRMDYHHYQIDSASDNKSSALIYLRRYARGRDSIYTASKAKTDENLRVLYDVQKKEFELNENKRQLEIVTRNEQLGRANLKQAVFIRDVIIAFSVILIIVGIVLYRLVLLNRKAVSKIGKSYKVMERLVSEKEWLLKEIHHRIKNNLHTVICLLEAQSVYLEKDALKAIEDSRHRIYAMSLMHEKLYENDEMKSIQMGDYVNSLITYLRDSFGLKSNILFDIDIAPVLIPTSVAIPISMIINEAVTNSIKYAFPANTPGKIEIKLEEQGPDIIVIIKDNGIGLNEELQTKPPGSMGMRLMKGLSGDIGGKIAFSNNNGTEIKLICQRTFVIDESIDLEELINNIPNSTQ